MAKHDKPALRNWTAAANPLLRKGGMHRKSRKHDRQTAKANLRRDARRDSSPAHSAGRVDRCPIFLPA